MVAAAPISSGSASARFYFRGTQAGAPQITATSSPMPPATQGETVTAASPSKLAFKTAPQTVGRQCQAQRACVSRQLLNVRLRTGGKQQRGAEGRARPGGENRMRSNCIGYSRSSGGST